MRVLYALLLITITLSVTAIPAHAQDDAGDMEAEARSAASEWIAQIDTAAYALSYRHAAPLVQEGVSEEQWAEAVKSAREQTGELEARTFNSAQYTTTLPDAPDGEYVLIQYSSMFANVPSANEIVVMMRTQDGSWKTAGYRVAPAQPPQN